MKSRTGFLLLATLWLLSGLDAMAQNQSRNAPPDASVVMPSPKTWGMSTPGAKLALREKSRAEVQGTPVIIYELWTTGLPKDLDYTMWIWDVGTDPRSAANVLLNDEGKAVFRRANSALHVTEEPLDFKVAAVRAEPKRVGLVTNDGRLRAYGEIVPFPVEASSGSCHLSIQMLDLDYSVVRLQAAGFQPNEELTIESGSAKDSKQQAKASQDGTYAATLNLPDIKTPAAGKVSVQAKSCTVKVEFP